MSLAKPIGNLNSDMQSTVSGFEHRTIYKKCVDEANAFKCPKSKHRGPIEPYPPFDERENDESAFLLLKDAKTLLGEELICYHTRIPLPETSLGIGVSISRLPRTGEIRSVTPTVDLLSLRAFSKLKVRTSISSERFTHWLPLYFGEKDSFVNKTQVFNKETDKYE